MRELPRCPECQKPIYQNSVKCSGCGYKTAKNSEEKSKMPIRCEYKFSGGNVCGEFCGDRFFIGIKDVSEKNFWVEYFCEKHYNHLAYLADPIFKKICDNADERP